MLIDLGVERLSWVSVFTALALGILARDCVLIATALFLALHVARTELETREDIDLIRAAIHCWLVSIASLLVAAILLAMVIGARVPLWEGNQLDTSLMLLVTGGCALMTSLSTTYMTTGQADGSRAIVFTAAILAVAFVARSFGDTGPCLFAISVAGFVAVTGWRLGRTVGMEMARSAVRI